MRKLLRVASLAVLFLAGDLLAGNSPASDGSLDPTFGQNGIALAGPGQWDHIGSNASGDFAVAGPCLGAAPGMNPCFLVVDAEGGPKATFNGGNSVTVTNPPCDFYAFPTPIFFKLLLDTQGRIVVVANCNNNTTFAMRFDASGTRDLGFGDNGYERYPDCPADSAAYSAALDRSDRLIVMLQCGLNTVVSRRNVDGSVDPLFGSAGYAATSFTSENDRFDLWYGVDLALDGEDRLLLAGVCGPGSAPYHCVARLNGDGLVDDNFGTQGIAVQPVSAGLADRFSLNADALGRVLVVTTYDSTDSFPIAVSRLDASGAADATFGDQGVAGLSFGSDCLLDGSFVDSGNRSVLRLSCQSDSLVRFTESGMLDDTFGSSGVVTMPLDAFNDMAATLPVGQGGRYLLAGTCGAPAVACVVRLWNDAIFSGGFDL